MAVGKTVFGLWWQEAILDYVTVSRKPDIKELAKWLKTTENDIKSRFWAEYDPERDKFRPVGLHCDELRVIVWHMVKKYPYFCVTNSSILNHESKRIRRSLSPLWVEHVNFPRYTPPSERDSWNPKRRVSHKKPVLGSLRDVPRVPDNLGDNTRLDGSASQED
jgi:hypothetical protein